MKMNTKQYWIEDTGKRVTSDVGKNTVARGLENQLLQELQIQGELG